MLISQIIKEDRRIYEKKRDVGLNGKKEDGKEEEEEVVEKSDSPP